MRVSIHQPNFTPWLPFFQKIEQVDLFILLGYCQYEKNGYQNRFNYQDKWYTLPTARGLEPIRDKKYLNPHDSWTSLKDKLPQYKKILSQFDDCIGESLYNTNKCIIKRACKILKITTPIIPDYPSSLNGTDRLVDICRTYGATTYLSGASGPNYLETHKFQAAGITVEVQTTKPEDKITLMERLCLDL